MYEIETAILLLRQFTQADLEDLYRFYSNPEVMKYAGGVRTQKQVEIYINRVIESWQQHNFNMWAMQFKKDRRIIGRCGLCFLDKTPEVELGYVLDKSYWNMGLTTEASKASLKYGFEMLNLDKIVAIANPQNVASRRVMEKVGMKYEKEAFYYNTNVVFYSILKTEYGGDDFWYVLRDSGSSKNSNFQVR